MRYITCVCKVCWLYLQVAIPDVLTASKDADILIFVVPHQFIHGLCKTMAGKIKKDALAVSLIKVSFQF